MSNALSHSRACMLGAINGLLAGGVAYVVLWLSVEYENQRLREDQLSGGDIMHVSVGITWWGFPLIGLIAFTVGSFLVHRWVNHRINSSVLFWQLVGGVSAVCGILFWLIIALIGHWSGAVPVDFEKLHLLALLLSGITVFVYVAVINLFYGAFIQLVATSLLSRRRSEYR